MSDKNELTELISATVETLIDRLRPDLVVALTSIAMATIDKAQEIHTEARKEASIKTTGGVQ